MRSERFEIEGEDEAWLAERLPLLLVRAIGRLCLMVGQVVVGVILVVVLIGGVFFIFHMHQQQNAAGDATFLWGALTVFSIALFIIRINRIAEFFGLRYDNGSGKGVHSDTDRANAKR